MERSLRMREPDPEWLQQRWDALTTKNDPISPPPHRWGAQAEACEHLSLYAARYESDAFSSLEEFQVFCWHGSSAQQILFSQGPCAEVLEWFAPERSLPSHLVQHLQREVAGHAEVHAALRLLNLKPELSWLAEVNYEVASVDSEHAPEISIVAKAAEGWVAFFTIDSDLGL